jgi:acid phosphatase
VRRAVPLALIAALLVLTGCASGPGTRRPASAPSAPPQPPRVTKVLTVVLENKGEQTATRGMPQLAALARRYGQATRWSAARHPSLPNYLALAGGSTSGVADDRSPSVHPLHGPSVFDLALATGHTAVTYAESMPRPCTLTSTGRYAVRHNPWTYYADPASRRLCASHDLPLGTLTSGALHADVVRGTLPAVGLVVPDLCDDAHDCPMATADAWLAGWTKQVMDGPDWRAGRLALVVTFDEAETVGPNTVLTVVAAPQLSHRVVTAPLSHLSWTRWVSDLVGAQPPRGAAGAPSLGSAFGL